MIHPIRLTLLLATLLCATTRAPAQTPTPPDPDPLATLRKVHPRIMALDADWQKLKQTVASDPIAKRWYETLQKHADGILRDPPVEYVLVGPRLLDKSRTALHRITTLAGLYRLSGNKAYADRARREMLAVAAFKDWHPDHFLDTAEMTNAVGIGYDWLYDYLSPDDRTTIRNAIIKHGLQPGKKGYEKNGRLAHLRNNWGNVCGAGLTVGALAIADEEPDLARFIITECRKGIASATSEFAPDGGYPEGPGYWSYASSYLCYHMAALNSALGNDLGISKFPGLSLAGDFRMHISGPVRKSFNYADCADGVGATACMLYLANIYNRPDYAQHELPIADDHGGIFHLLWYRPQDNATPAVPPLDARFTAINVALFRSAWNDPNALYAGIKGGSNSASHAHLDLGSFVFDALGHRWASDLGSDDYNLPGYFGTQRWSYFRLATEGHNTLTINRKNQSTNARAPITSFYSSPQRASTVIDLKGAYKKTLTSWKRGLAMLDRKRLLLQDELQAPQPVEVVWNMITCAEIELAPDASSAVLSLPEGKSKSTRLALRLLSPPGARFTIASATPPAPQKPNTGYRKLTVVLANQTNLRIAVLFSPVDDTTQPAALEPLDTWPGAVKPQ